MSPRTRFFVELAAAAASALLLVLTLVWQDWIEIAFGVDPDRHDGAVEWLIVVALLAVAVGLGRRAHASWRRLQHA